MYETELAGSSSSLRQLGELGLHELLMEMRAQRLIDYDDEQTNRWVATVLTPDVVGVIDFSLAAS